MISWLNRTVDLFPKYFPAFLGKANIAPENYISK